LLLTDYRGLHGNSRGRLPSPKPCKPYRFSLCPCTAFLWLPMAQAVRATPLRRTRQVGIAFWRLSMAQAVRVIPPWRTRLAQFKSVIISLHVRSLPIVEAKADNRGAVRHCRLARRLKSSVQHRSHAASPGDSAASEGTNPSNFDYALGTCSLLGKRPFHYDRIQSCFLPSR
jgi:hypothetical protein